MIIFSCPSAKSHKDRAYVLTALSLYFFLITFIGAAQDRERSINFVTDQIKEGGFIEELTKRACEEAGYDIDIQHMPWVRALNGTMEGTFEALLGATYTPERAERLLYSDLIGQSQLLLFYMKGRDFDFDDFGDLDGYRIGYIRGGWIPPSLANVELEIIDTTEWTLSIKQLAAGRIDMFIGLRYSVLDMIEKEFPSYVGEIVFFEEPLAEFNYYNCFPKGNPDSFQRLNDFNRGLRAIIDNGTYDRIMSLGLHE